MSIKIHRNPASVCVLRYMLQNSGLDDVIGNAVANASLPLVLVALVISFFA